MIYDFDLFDISATFLKIREDITYSLNVEILCKIIKTLENDNSNNIMDNKIRSSLASIENIDREKWEFVFHNNFYVNFLIIKDGKIKKILIRFCQILKQCIKEKHFDKAIAFADTIHEMPNAFAQSLLPLREKYLKHCFKMYQKKWDKGFWKREKGNLGWG